MKFYQASWLVKKLSALVTLIMCIGFTLIKHSVTEPGPNTNPYLQWGMKFINRDEFIT